MSRVWPSSRPDRDPEGTLRYLCRGGTVEFFESGWLDGQDKASNSELPSGGLRYILKGLILAQNERWRRGLGMQVAGIPAMGEPA